MMTLGGAIARLLKKRFGLDIRGRILEAIVVLFTLWLDNVGWGLVWAFFEEGDCGGVREQFSNLLQSKGLEMVKKVLQSYQQPLSILGRQDCWHSLDHESYPRDLTTGRRYSCFRMF